MRIVNKYFVEVRPSRPCTSRNRVIHLHGFEWLSIVPEAWPLILTLGPSKSWTNWSIDAGPFSWQTIPSSIKIFRRGISSWINLIPWHPVFAKLQYPLIPSMSRVNLQSYITRCRVRIKLRSSIQFINSISARTSRGVPQETQKPKFFCHEVPHPESRKKV